MKVYWEHRINIIDECQDFLKEQEVEKLVKSGLGHFDMEFFAEFEGGVIGDIGFWHKDYIDLLNMICSKIYPMQAGSFLDITKSLADCILRHTESYRAEEEGYRAYGLFKESLKDQEYIDKSTIFDH